MKTLWNIPASAKSDPPTSALAAADVTASGQRLTNTRRVADLIARMPGRSTRELAATADAVELGIDRYEMARRASDALHLGWVRQGNIRKCREGFKNAVTWYALDGTTAYDADLESR